MAACMGSKNNPQKHTNILLQYIKGQMETSRALDLMVEESEAKKKVLPGKIRHEKQDRVNKIRICIFAGVVFFLATIPSTPAVYHWQQQQQQQ